MGSSRLRDQPRTAAAHLAPPPAARPVLANEVPRFMLLEREVEDEFRPQMLQGLQHKIHTLAEVSRQQAPICPGCSHPMRYQDQPAVSWLTRFGRLRARASRYRCPACKQECRPLLEQLGVEPGRVSGSLARLLALLGVVVPYELAARLTWLFFGVQVSPMSVWRAVQRLGEAAGRYSDGLSQYHADSRSQDPPTGEAPQVVVLGVDGCQLGMQVRAHRRRRKGNEKLPPLPPIKDGRFREVKTGVLLLPSERVEASPGRHSLVRRFLVSCLGDADAIFGHLWARLRERGWLGAHTVVVIVGDGAEWIWKRATLFERRCEILDFWHAVEHAWGFARLRYGEGSQRPTAGCTALPRTSASVTCNRSSPDSRPCARRRRSCGKIWRRSSATTPRTRLACATTSTCAWAMGSAAVRWRALTSRSFTLASVRPGCDGPRPEPAGSWRYVYSY
jgi:hypothetical protein